MLSWMPACSVPRTRAQWRDFSPVLAKDSRSCFFNLLPWTWSFSIEMFSFFSSFRFSRSIASDSLWPQKPQHARPPCPSPIPRVYPNSCPLSRWCHPTISPSHHLIQPSHPLLSPSPPALNLSQHQGLFKWVSPLHQVAKVLEFQLQHQSFQWTLRTDSFRMDWLDLLASQGTLKSLLQHHSSKASVLWHFSFLGKSIKVDLMYSEASIASNPFFVCQYFSHGKIHWDPLKWGGEGDGSTSNTNREK